MTASTPETVDGETRNQSSSECLRKDQKSSPLPDAVKGLGNGIRRLWRWVADAGLHLIDFGDDFLCSGHITIQLSDDIKDKFFN